MSVKKLLPVFFVFLAGCSSKPVEGLVTAKRHEAAYEWVYMMPMTVSDGKNTTTTFIPIIMYEPERWVLTVEPYDKDGNPKQTVRVLVTPEAYDAAKLGTWFKQTDDVIDTRKARKVREQ